MSSHEPNWYWSQRGSTMGPIDLKEIRRLAATGSIEYSTWIFDPRAQAWLVAGSIDGVFMKPVPPVPTGPAAPPDATTDPTTDSTTDPTTDSTTDPNTDSTTDSTTDPNTGGSTSFNAGEFKHASTSSSSSSFANSSPHTSHAGGFCRFCGARTEQHQPRCTACGRDNATSQTTVEPRVAEVICRASVLAAPALTVLAFIGPAMVWALGSSNPRVVEEAKRTINCLLTLLIALTISAIFGAVGVFLILPTVIAVLVSIGIGVYCVVVGILGLIATASNKPFRYPWMFNLIK